MDDNDKRRRRAIRNFERGLDWVDLGEPYPSSVKRESKEEATRDLVKTLTLPTTWAYLRSWLARYAAGHPIAGVDSITFTSRQTHAYTTGMKFRAAIEGAYQGEVVLPLFEFTIFEDETTCAVTPRSNEPSLAGYYRDLLLAIAEHWPETTDSVSNAVAGLPKAVKRLSDVQLKAIREYLKAERTPGLILTSRDYGSYSYRQTIRLLKQAAETGQLDDLRAQMHEEGKL